MTEKKKSKDVIIYKKKSLKLPKDLNLSTCWAAIGPLIVKEIKDFGYCPIPYFLDNDAYKIGSIFVAVETQVDCFRKSRELKILGPIQDFIIEEQTNLEWKTDESFINKSDEMNSNFKITLGKGKSMITFSADNCIFLSINEDTVVENNVTIDRNSNEDLSNVRWIGVITEVMLANAYGIHIVRDDCERKTFMNDHFRTILFKYNMYKLNEEGRITKIKTVKNRYKWQSLGGAGDQLPLSTFEIQENEVIDSLP